MEMEYIAIIGIFLGVLIRTLAPAIRKMFKDEEFKWDHKYTATCIISVLVAIIVTMMVFSTFVIPEANATNVLVAGFMFGFSMDAFINEVLAWLNQGNNEKVKAVTPAS